MPMPTTGSSCRRGRHSRFAPTQASMATMLKADTRLPAPAVQRPDQGQVRSSSV